MEDKEREVKINKHNYIDEKKKLKNISHLFI